MKVVYLGNEADESDSDSVKAYGVKFVAGKPVEVDEAWRKKVAGNPYFEIVGGAKSAPEAPSHPDAKPPGQPTQPAKPEHPHGEPPGQTPEHDPPGQSKPGPGHQPADEDEDDDDDDEAASVVPRRGPGRPRKSG